MDDLAWNVARFAPPALAVAGWWAWRGHLRPSALNAGPMRDLPLTFIDVAVAAGLFVAGMLAAGTILPLLGMAGRDLDPASFTPGQTAVSTLVIQLSTQGLAVLYVVVRCGLVRSGLRRLGLVPRRPVMESFLATGALLGSLPVVFFVLSASVWIASRWAPVPETGHAMLDAMQAGPGWPRWVMIGCAVVLAPLFEETLFRGLFQSAFLRSTDVSTWRWEAVGVGSVLFTLMHLSSVPWQALPGLFVLSLVLGWLYERTGSLWPGILVHAGFNAVNTALALSQAGNDGLKP